MALAGLPVIISCPLDAIIQGIASTTRQGAARADTLCNPAAVTDRARRRTPVGAAENWNEILQEAAEGTEKNENR